MKNRFLIIVLFLLPSVILAIEPIYTVKKYPNGQLKYEGYFIDGKPIGEFKRYHENGNLSIIQNFDKVGNSSVKIYTGEGDFLAEGQYVGEKRDGEWKFYTKKKALFIVEHYSLGKRTGEKLVYYEDGTIMNKMYYKNDLQDSVYLQYYQNGNVMAKFYYKNGKIDGPFVSYYEAGELDRKGEYVNGKREGTWLIYKEDGKADEIIYKNGVSEQMNKMIRAESDSSDVDRNFKDPEDYISNPSAYFER
ncbi:MAG: toxin-antitoxin system YwqK family antitoxin [Paludibacteraceae bacterium]|jgi:antitoxin component YwqK of YwqJK toxin-antitoxin module|nr:toxin-antitoxin system YwqK family antitoxin [Paludibacteraceae bacterium]